MCLTPHADCAAEAPKQPPIFSQEYLDERKLNVQGGPGATVTHDMSAARAESSTLATVPEHVAPTSNGSLAAARDEYVKSRRATGGAEVKASTLPFPPIAVTFRNVCYTVPMPTMHEQ